MTPVPGPAQKVIDKKRCHTLGLSLANYLLFTITLPIHIYCLCAMTLVFRAWVLNIYSEE